VTQRGIVLAWALGLGIMTWREVKTYKKPPVPGRILAGSAVFIALALLADYPPATRAATWTAWGFDVALLLKPGLLPGTGTSAAAAGQALSAETGGAL
jgi:hypothetical protein